MAAQRYFLDVLGTNYAILNAPVRRGPEDVVCLRGLTPEQQLRFSQMKERGEPDDVVFRELFPEQPRRRQSPAGDLGRPADRRATIMFHPSCEILPRSFAILAALRNENGSPRPVATAQLGDWARLKSLTIDSGEVTVTLLSRAA